MMIEVICFFKKNVRQLLCLIGLFIVVFTLLQASALYYLDAYEQREASASKVVLSWNIRSVLEKGMNDTRSSVKAKDVSNLSKSPYVKNVNCVQNVTVKAKDNEYTLTGQSDPPDKRFIQGRDLRLKEASASAIISKEIASKEHVTTGQYLSVRTDKATAKLKIVGIYEDQEDRTIYTTLRTAQKLNGSTLAMTTAVFQLKHKSMIKAFIQYAYNQDIDWQQLDLRIEKDEKRQISLLPLIAIPIAILVISLSVYQMIHKREKEFIARCYMGETKSHIIAQLSLELFMIALPASLIPSCIFFYFISRHDPAHISMNLILSCLIFLIALVIPIRKLRRTLYVKINA